MDFFIVGRLILCHMIEMIFLNLMEQKKGHIQTADGELTVVSGSGTVEISPTLKLKSCLYVPKLSHKLMSAMLRNN